MVAIYRARGRGATSRCRAQARQCGYQKKQWSQPRLRRGATSRAQRFGCRWKKSQITAAASKSRGVGGGRRRGRVLAGPGVATALDRVERHLGAGGARGVVSMRVWVPRPGSASGSREVDGCAGQPSRRDPAGDAVADRRVERHDRIGGAVHPDDRRPARRPAHGGDVGEHAARDRRDRRDQLGALAGEPIHHHRPVREAGREHALAIDGELAATESISAARSRGRRAGLGRRAGRRARRPSGPGGRSPAGRRRPRRSDRPAGRTLPRVRRSIPAAVPPRPCSTSTSGRPGLASPPACSRYVRVTPPTTICRSWVPAIGRAQGERVAVHDGRDGRDDDGPRRAGADGFMIDRGGPRLASGAPSSSAVSG